MIEDLNHLLRANHGVLGGGSERAVRLSAIAPHASADPFPRHSFANLINDARTIAVRNDPWIRHPDVKRVFTFLNITWIHARKSDTNPNFARTGLRIFHFAQNEYIPGRALPFIPSGFHKFTWMFTRQRGFRYVGRRSIFLSIRGSGISHMIATMT